MRAEQEELYSSSARQEIFTDNCQKFQISMKNAAESVYQILPKMSKMITPVKDIEFIVSLYPNPLRNLHTIFQLDKEGATSPFFLHSQVAFALIQISQSKGDFFIRKYINNYSQENNSKSLVVLDDEELFDLRIVCTLLALQNYKETPIFYISPIDNTEFINMIWEENIDIRLVNSILNQIDVQWTFWAKNYIISDYQVKMPLREDDNSNVIINIIFERQIKKLFEYFYRQNLRTNLSQNIEFFVISASDPTVILNYASISVINNTLDTIVDPNELEYWILIVLDQLAFLHRILHTVNLNIIPKNIFISNKDELNMNQEKVLSMDLGSALILDLDGERQYYVQIATKQYCSPKFLQACISQTPLSAKELIEEDHYQILCALDDVCKGRKDLTEETKIILDILRSTDTIEDAIYRISKNLELIHKVFSRLIDSELEVGLFAISFLRNICPQGLGNKPLKSIELLLQCEPYYLAKQLLDYTICFLSPMLIFEDKENEFRQKFRSLSNICKIQWLSPLLVLIDYLELNQDDTEEEISKQLKLLQETISQLSVSDQKKTLYAIRNGFHLFFLNCKQDSEANRFQFSHQLIKRALQLTKISQKERKMLIILDEKYKLIVSALQLTELSEKERNMLAILDEKYQLSTQFDTIQVVPAFRKKSIKPYNFIARHSYPKGLFQVVPSGGTNYYLSLTCQPNRLYREINEQQLIEVPCFEYMVLFYDDRQMIVVDRAGDIQGFENDDKLIEIEFKKAQERGRVCFVQVAGESGAYFITGLRIEVQQIEQDIQKASFIYVKNKCDQAPKEKTLSYDQEKLQKQFQNLSEAGGSIEEIKQSQGMVSPMQTDSVSCTDHIHLKKQFDAIEITDEKGLSKISSQPENQNWENEVRMHLTQQQYLVKRESLISKSRMNLPGFQAIGATQNYQAEAITEYRNHQEPPRTYYLKSLNADMVTQSEDMLALISIQAVDKDEVIEERIREEQEAIASYHIIY